jgi:2-dehydro-3-deoxyphosphogluconate aldolase/(4S)-4-hydroxy-2-oxoglutarate aldolase
MEHNNAELFLSKTIIPVLEIERIDDALPLAKALIDGGLNVLEIILHLAPFLPLNQ